MKISVSVTKVKNNKIKTLNELLLTDVDYIHVDTMDGKFVNNKQLLIPEVLTLFNKYPKKLDIHLMVEDPKEYIEKLKHLNVFAITIHSELNEDMNELIDLIHSYNIKAGIAINPDTKVSQILKYLDVIDLVLVMGVVPGEGGQGMIHETPNKLRELKEYRDKNNLNYLISFDGGVNNETRSLLDDSDMLVSGSYVCLGDNLQERIDTLR